METLFAILGEDSYVRRLSLYANLRRSIGLTAVPFSSLSAYRHFSKTHRIPLLLADTDSSDLCRSLTEELRQLSPDAKPRIVALQGASAPSGTASAAQASDLLSRCDAVISKYQSADGILRETSACCSRFGIAFRPPITDKRTRVIGIYSPVGRCGKTAFSLLLCKLLAKSGPVLYLNFEPFSGFAALTGETSYKTCLSDAVYALKQGQLDGAAIRSMIYRFSGIDYIAPMRFAEDLNADRQSELAELIDQILRNSPYETIVLDLGAFSSTTSALLDLCSSVYVPTREDRISQAKIAELEHYLSVSGRDLLLEKLQKITLPLGDAGAAQSFDPDALLCGPFGDFIRENVHECR